MPIRQLTEGRYEPPIRPGHRQPRQSVDGQNPTGDDVSFRRHFCCMLAFCPGVRHDSAMKKVLLILSMIVGQFSSLLMASPAEDAQKNRSQDEFLLYVSTAIYTTSAFPGGGKTEPIYAYRFNARTGKLTPLGLAAETVNPGFLAVHPNHQFLYTVNEVSDFRGPDTGGVSAFRIDRKTGKLTFLNDVISPGGNPCYVSVDKTGKYILVANYYGGRVEVFPILDGGRLGEATARVQHTGKSQHPQWQEAPHPHLIKVSPDNRFALVPDLGLDQILVYRFDATKGLLTPNDPPFVKGTPGAGPRHIAFPPNGKFVYLINSFEALVSVFAYDPDKGSLQPLQTISALPKDFKGENTGAHIVMSPSGKFVYTSNRGHDSIAVFSVDPVKGTLAPVEHVSTRGKMPRNFAIDPTGNYLIVANQESDKLVVFHIDPETGHLTPGQVVTQRIPVCVRFAGDD